MKRETPNAKFQNMSRSSLALTCAAGHKIFTPTLKDDKDLSLNKMNVAVRDALDIKKYKYYTKDERAKLKDIHIVGKAIASVSGKYVFVDNETYWSYDDMENEEVIAVWFIRGFEPIYY